MRTFLSPIKPVIIMFALLVTCGIGRAANLELSAADVSSTTYISITWSAGTGNAAVVQGFKLYLGALLSG